MRIISLYEDRDGVAPVVATILMVAIVVILAAVVAVFVLGVGEDVDDIAPQASFAFEWDDSQTARQDVLNVSHTGGDTVRAKNLYVRGDRGSGTIAVPGGCIDLDQSFDAYPIDSSGATMDPNSDVKATGLIKVNCIAPDGDIDIIWQNNEGGEESKSATLAQWSGPTA